MYHSFSVLQIWENYSPYLRRNLINRDEIHIWTEDLKLTSFSSEKDDLFFLLDYLEEVGLFYPIFCGKIKSKIAQLKEKLSGIIYFRNLMEHEKNKHVKLYHLIQFFQFISYWNIYKKFNMEESKFNFDIKIFYIYLYVFF